VEIEETLLLVEERPVDSDARPLPVVLATE
jgi:hypothetical protein